MRRSTESLVSAAAFVVLLSSLGCASSIKTVPPGLEIRIRQGCCADDSTQLGNSPLHLYGHSPLAYHVDWTEAIAEKGLEKEFTVLFYQHGRLLGTRNWTRRPSTLRVLFTVLLVGFPFYFVPEEMSFDLSPEIQRGYESAYLDARDKELRRKGIPIGISEFWMSSPNSVGGVSLSISFTNLGTKDIKYFTADIAVVNAVGDVVADRIRGADFQPRLKITGPVPAATSRRGTWEAFFYGHDSHCLRIRSLLVEFMDGTRISIANASEALLVQNDERVSLCK